MGISVTNEEFFEEQLKGKNCCWDASNTLGVGGMGNILELVEGGRGILHLKVNLLQQFLVEVVLFVLGGR